MSETELPTESAALVRHLIEEAPNNGNEEIVHEVFAESVEPLMDAEPDSLTPEMMWSNLSDLRDAMPDLHYEIKDIRQASDKVYVEYTMTGTFENEMEVHETVFESTGEYASMDGIIVTRFDDDKIDGWGNFAQNLEGFQDLGIVPSFEELAG
jgi:hypothetical protein